MFDSFFKSAEKKYFGFYSRSAALRQYQGFDDCFVDNRLTISRLVSYLNEPLEVARMSGDHMATIFRVTVDALCIGRSWADSRSTDPIVGHQSPDDCWP